ncbi:MAG: cupin domain-containing protein [Pyrinomonadaceae bacterium]
MDIIPVEDLDTAIEQYKALGYRLDMIFPADNPREAVMLMGEESVRLIAGPKSNVQSLKSQDIADIGHETLDLRPASDSEWTTGRAGMEYRDLIPDRMDGKVIASHIRLATGGEVPDYVHYHKIDLQMIYCLKGRIKVVYEDQGEPFWLEPGDCVLQPPEIRHRVLECEANSEVIEITMPAEHETWAEHEISLPTTELKPDRGFGGQRFFCHKAVNSDVPSADEPQNSLNIEDYCVTFVEQLLTEGEISTKYKEYCRTFAEKLTEAVRNS